MVRRVCALMIGIALAVPHFASAQQAERYVPGIWIDPDGCEHWVMDDGAEGYMSPHLRRDGTPVCHTVSRCAVVPTDTMFATGSATIAPGGAESLRHFFAANPANGFVIEGHTDSRGSDASNMALSERRARAVGQVAQQAGARVYSVRGFGEGRSVASNANAAGMAENRRVDILCLR
jgi:outer membrane protein OmpA-like peptidoglycan-associated protein